MGHLETETIESHKVEGYPSPDIETMGMPGSAGAHYGYCLSWPRKMLGEETEQSTVALRFQHGDPRGTDGINGLSETALVAIVMHRLNGFQSRKFKCKENEEALEKLASALYWLRCREMKEVHITAEKNKKKETEDVDT